MSRSRSFAVALGLLAVLVAAAGSGIAGGKLDSPEAKLRARIADLHAEVALLDVECEAARHNLLESLKKSGQLEFGEKQGALSKIKDELRQFMGSARAAGFGDSNEFKELLEKTKSGKEQFKEQDKLVAEFFTRGDDSEKALDRLGEIEFKTRFDSARAESERMKADFLKTCRLLHKKKLELADAEAEYKATK